MPVEKCSYVAISTQSTQSIDLLLITLTIAGDEKTGEVTTDWRRASCSFHCMSYQRKDDLYLFHTLTQTLGYGNTLTFVSGNLRI